MKTAAPGSLSIPLFVALLVTACAVELPSTQASGGTAAVAPGAVWTTLPTNAYRGKRDDIVFADAKTGFYGTGAGDLFRTQDGGANWTRVWSKPGTFIRALGFIDASNGFLGNVGDYYPGVTDTTPLYQTRDGGVTWTPVTIGGAPTAGGGIPGICAIDIVSTRGIYQGALRGRTIVHAAGRVGGPAKLLRSVDGGETWSVIDMSAHAGMILDVKFLDANNGLVFAGSSSDVAQSEASILRTTDGGRSWKQVYRSARKSELSWKGSFADAHTGYATIQSYDPARAAQVVVKTTDAGATWTEMPLVQDAKARQFGIGFADARTGWVGTAAGGFETRDGGVTWAKVPLAPAANKIRTRASDGTPMVYGIGTQVQRLLPPVG